jgi:hypothetical protein
VLLPWSIWAMIEKFRICILSPPSYGALARMSVGGADIPVRLRAADHSFAL